MSKDAGTPDGNSSPACAEHSQHSAKTVVRAGRGSGEQGEETDNTSGEHLLSCLRSPQCGSKSCTHHSELASEPVRQIAEGEHADDCASERHARERGAIVVLGDCGLAVDTGQHCVHAVRSLSMERGGKQRTSVN